MDANGGWPGKKIIIVDRQNHVGLHSTAFIKNQIGLLNCIRTERNQIVKIKQCCIPRWIISDHTNIIN